MNTNRNEPTTGDCIGVALTMMTMTFCAFLAMYIISHDSIIWIIKGGYF